MSSFGSFKMSNNNNSSSNAFGKSPWNNHINQFDETDPGSAWCGIWQEQPTQNLLDDMIKQQESSGFSLMLLHNAVDEPQNHPAADPSQSASLPPNSCHDNPMCTLLPPPESFDFDDLQYYDFIETGEASTLDKKLVADEIVEEPKQEAGINVSTTLGEASTLDKKLDPAAPQGVGNAEFDDRKTASPNNGNLSQTLRQSSACTNCFCSVDRERMNASCKESYKKLKRKVKEQNRLIVEIIRSIEEMMPSTKKDNKPFDKLRCLAALFEKNHRESRASGQAQFLKRSSMSGSRSRSRWSDHEHRLFLDGLREVENSNIKQKWKYISGKIQSKSSSQVASHAQKFSLHLRNTAAGAEENRKRKQKSIFCRTLEK